MFGSVQGYASNMFDAFNNNNCNFVFGAPLLTKTDSNKYKHTILDFIFSGDYTYTRDQNPSFTGTSFVDPTDLAAIQALIQLLQHIPEVLIVRLKFITSSQIVNQSWHQNDAQDVIGVNQKLNFISSDLVKITVGGSYQFQTQHDRTYVYQMYNSSEDPLDNTTNYKGYIRLTQQFYTPPDSKGKKISLNMLFTVFRQKYQPSTML